MKYVVVAVHLATGEKLRHTVEASDPWGAWLLTKEEKRLDPEEWRQSHVLPVLDSHVTVLEPPD